MYKLYLVINLLNEASVNLVNSFFRRILVFFLLHKHIKSDVKKQTKWHCSSHITSGNANQEINCLFIILSPIIYLICYFKSDFTFLFIAIGLKLYVIGL